MTEATTPLANLPAILCEPFPAAMSKEAAFAMRDSLHPQTSGSMAAFLLFAIADREHMVEAFRNVAETQGMDEALNLIEAVSYVRENMERALTIARMVQARAIVTAHEAFGIEWPDDAEQTNATVECLA